MESEWKEEIFMLTMLGAGVSRDSCARLGCRQREKER